MSGALDKDSFYAEAATGVVQPAEVTKPEPTIFPASAWQERYWADAKLARGGVALNVAMRWQVEGPLSDSSIEKALRAVMDRHEILRTRFCEQNGCLQQYVEPSPAFKVGFIDLQRLPETSRWDEAQHIGAKQAVEPFNLEEAPLLRATLVRLTSDRAILHLTFHHLIVDGWSIGMIIREFGQLAAAFEDDMPLSLPEVQLHYGDYTVWQREMLQSGALNAERDYWLMKLNGLPRFEVEPDYPRPPEGSNKGEIRSILLPRDLTDAIEKIARMQGQTLFSIATASLAAMLHRVTGEAEVVIGTQIAGRDEVEAEAIVGPLINSLVLRFTCDDQIGFDKFANNVRGSIQDALAHQRLPFDVLTRLAGEDKNRSRPPLYAINFVLQKAYIDAAKTSDSQYGRFKLVSLPSHSPGALWDLNFFMVGRDEGWRMSCEVNTGLYSVETGDRLLALWRQVLEAIMREVSTPISELLFLEEAEIRRSRAPRPAPLRIGESPKFPQGKSQRHNPRLAALQQRILQLQPNGHKTPVIALNNTAIFYPLSNYLGQDRPFIDIQFCPPSTAKVLPPRHFRDIARDAVEMIRLARPEGPYILLGLCSFGHVAFEAAQILKEEGEEIPLLVLNDSWAPGYREAMPWHHRQIRAWQVRLCDLRRDWKAYYSGKITLSEFLNYYSIIRKTRLVDLAVRLKLLAPSPRDDLADLENKWFTDYLMACQAGFRPERYDSNVMIFRSQQAMLGRFFDYDFGWKNIVSGQLDVFPCPGMHAEMFRDAGAKVIAQHMNAVLAEIERPS